MTTSTVLLKEKSPPVLRIVSGTEFSISTSTYDSKFKRPRMDTIGIVALAAILAHYITVCVFASHTGNVENHLVCPLVLFFQSENKTFFHREPKKSVSYG